MKKHSWSEEQLDIVRMWAAQWIGRRMKSYTGVYFEVDHFKITDRGTGVCFYNANYSLKKSWKIPPYMIDKMQALGNKPRPKKFNRPKFKFENPQERFDDEC